MPAAWFPSGAALESRHECALSQVGTRPDDIRCSMDVKLQKPIDHSLNPPGAAVCVHGRHARPVPAPAGGRADPDEGGQPQALPGQIQGYLLQALQEVWVRFFTHNPQLFVVYLHNIASYCVCRHNVGVWYSKCILTVHHILV